MAIIESRQKTSADKHHARRSEIIRTDESPIRIRPVLCRLRSFLEIDIVAPGLTREREDGCISACFYTWDFPSALNHLWEKLRSPRGVLVMPGRPGEPQGEDVRYVPQAFARNTRTR